MRFLPFALMVAMTIPARAAGDDEDWTAFGHMLTLVQTMVRIGMQPNPEQGITDVLSGRNYEANGALAGLFAGATAEMPQEHRDRVVSIGRDLAGHGGKQPLRAPSDQHRRPAASGER